MRSPVTSVFYNWGSKNVNFWVFEKNHIFMISSAGARFI